MPYRSVFCRTVAKKVSAGDFGRKSDFVVVADRFGDVYRIPITAAPEEAVIQPILGHFCSIITSLIVLDDNRRLVTCDRDGVARLSILPETQSEGSYVIQHFFMGHTKFISSAAVLNWNGRSLLATGGGDGLILLFDIETGERCSKFDIRDSMAPSDISGPVVVSSLSACPSRWCAFAPQFGERLYMPGHWLLSLQRVPVQFLSSRLSQAPSHS